MPNNKISVIVPVYNVESYLQKCLDSIINQSYKNLEIIIVDDNSTDNSLKIAKTYQKYANVKVLQNEKNMGLSFTRNRAMKEATGEYISFIDSDDYIPDNYYSSLMSTCNDSDVVVCDINIIYSSGAEERKKCGSDSKQRIDFINNGLAASACNKLFKKKTIESVQFEVGKQNEDLAFVLPIIILAPKVSYNSEVCYNYYQRETSIQNTGFSEKRFDIFNAVSLTLDRIKNTKN